MKRILLSTIVLTLLVGLSCRKKELIPGTYKSSLVTMAGGKVFSWVEFDKDGNPASLGFTLDEGALTNLPTSGMHGSEHNTFAIPLPPEIVSGTPFNHIVIDWNPTGHEPQAIYSEKHFDFHFYTISTEERMQIPVYSADSAKFKNKPAADYFPADYFNPGAIASDPAMGTHWVDAKSPELQPGGVFTETFVYGSYNGKVNFIEPMMTYDFFRNITDWSRSIPQPAKVQISGYYPKKLHIVHANGEYKLSLEDFYYRTAQ